MVKNTLGIDFPILKIAFNNNGKEQFYDFMGQNREVLKGIERFLTALNYNGISLERDTLKSLMEDAGCEVFDAKKPGGHFLISKKPGEATPDMDQAYMDFCALLKHHGHEISDETKSGLQQELGLVRTDCSQSKSALTPGQD